MDSSCTAGTKDKSFARIRNTSTVSLFVANFILQVLELYLSGRNRDARIHCGAICHLSMGVGVMAAGNGFGLIMQMEEKKRHKYCLASWPSSIALFLIIESIMILAYRIPKIRSLLFSNS